MCAKKVKLAAIYKATDGSHYCYYFQAKKLRDLRAQLHVLRNGPSDPSHTESSRPDYTLICAQADYHAEQLTRTARADRSTATDNSPGATVISDPDTITKKVRVRRLSRSIVCQQQSEQHHAAKLKGKSN